MSEEEGQHTWICPVLVLLLGVSDCAWKRFTVGERHTTDGPHPPSIQMFEHSLFPKMGRWNPGVCSRSGPWIIDPSSSFYQGRWAQNTVISRARWICDWGKHLE